MLFDPKNGLKNILPLYKLLERRGRFLVNNTVRTFQSKLHGNEAKYASGENIDYDTSEESVTYDDDASEESATDDDDYDSNEEATMDDDEDVSEKSSYDNDDASLANNVFKEIPPVKKTMNVNGFEVFSSQAEYAKRIFEKHPAVAIGFCAKNQHLKNACMNFLLGLIKTMSQSLKDLSNEDLVEADIALTYLKDAGFKVDWLEKKLDQLKGNKEKEKSGLVRLQEIEENLVKLKQKVTEMDDLAEKEKAVLSETRTPWSFDDLV